MSSFKSERELNTRFCANSPNAQYQINEDGSSQMYDFTAPPQQSFGSPEMIGSMQRILDTEYRGICCHRISDWNRSNHEKTRSVIQCRYQFCCFI